MPFSRDSSSSVEKSSSVEFTLVSRNGKPSVLMPGNTHYSRSPVLSRSPDQRKSPYTLSPNSSSLYSPLPVTLTSDSQHTVSLLPDIGAPDITDEIMCNERRASLDSTYVRVRTANANKAVPSLNHKISAAQHDSSAQRGTGKVVFYTHSMKKKSTEPKFV